MAQIQGQHASTLIDGVEALNAVLEELASPPVNKRLARPMLSAGTAHLARAIRKAAPPRTRIKKAIGRRMKKPRKAALYQAKVGINVGKMHGIAPHGHLFALGTRRRQTRSGSDRGTMPANDFVREASDRATLETLNKMYQVARDRIPKEVEKLRRKHERRAARAAGN